MGKDYEASLYGGTPPHNGTDTSKAAAEKAKPKAKTVRQQLFELIAAAGPQGMTADEVGSSTGRPAQSVSARLKELQELGLIKDSGRRRDTRYGRAARVYVLTNTAKQGKLL